MGDSRTVQVAGPSLAPNSTRLLHLAACLLKGAVTQRRFGVTKAPKTPAWERLLADAAHLQTKIPRAVLVKDLGAWNCPIGAN